MQYDMLFPPAYDCFEVWRLVTAKEEAVLWAEERVGHSFQKYMIEIESYHKGRPSVTTLQFVEYRLTATGSGKISNPCIGGSIVKIPLIRSHRNCDTHHVHEGRGQFCCLGRPSERQLKMKTLCPHYHGPTVN
ncbi:hypothetical protein J6590_051868 [Homalodisca vitripennis]|nr:hypothetical protein J6590_051868 [Homalodisca vitripennis]